MKIDIKIGQFLDRFLEKFAIFYFYATSFHFISLILSLIFYHYFWSLFKWLFFVYGIYYVYDFKRYNYGGHVRSFTSRLPINKHFANYFPISLTKTVDLDSARNYIFACAPHGIIPYGPGLNFMTNVNNFSTLFPGLRTHLLTLKQFFFVPLSREYFFSYGACAASKKTMRHILSNQGNWTERGQVCVLMIGGAREMLYSLPGESYYLILKNRKGFVRVALETGASLVPVFSFGENDLYQTKMVDASSWYAKFQVIFKKITSIGLPYGHGCGLFSQESSGWYPYRKPIHTIVGKPIHIDRITNPTKTQVDELHSEFINQLVDLFETHKIKFNSERHKKIVFVD